MHKMLLVSCHINHKSWKAVAPHCLYLVIGQSNRKLGYTMGDWLLNLGLLCSIFTGTQVWEKKTNELLKSYCSGPIL